MKDNEIIKALECCKKPVGTGACKDCPLDKDRPCTTTMIENALDLINCQQAEIERMIASGYALDIKTVKAEAIKEFAERLIIVDETTAINCATNEKVVRVTDIEDLVKEMVGDAE
jgi:hypothetical protein